MPKEFAHLQGQDMGKLGAVQDLVRGVEKLLGKGTAQTAQTTQPVIVQAAGGVSSDALLKRGNMALNDGNWKAADEFFDRVLDMNAECAEAYLGKFLARVQASDIAQYAQAKIDQAKKAEISAPKEAVEEDAARIDAAAQRFAVRDYLAEKDVRAQYAPPEPYRSVADYWRQAASLGKSRLASDADLTKARSFAAGALKERLAAEEKAFAARWDECVKQAERRDAQAKEAARKAYARRWMNPTARPRRSARRRRKSGKGFIRSFAGSRRRRRPPYDLKNLAPSFERLKEYKDSAARAQQCHKKAENCMCRKRRKRARKKARGAGGSPKAQAQPEHRHHRRASHRHRPPSRRGTSRRYSSPPKTIRRRKPLRERRIRAGRAGLRAMGDYEDAPERAQAIRFALAEAMEAAGIWVRGYPVWPAWRLFQRARAEFRPLGAGRRPGGRSAREMAYRRPEVGRTVVAVGNNASGGAT